MLRKLELSFLAAVLATMTSVPVALACDGKDGNAHKKEEKAPAKRVASATFRVEGMTCTGCSDKVKAALVAKAGIVKVAVAADYKKITVEYDQDKWTVSALAKLISDIGYQATAEA
jgi:copper chaperone CopZ